MGTSILAWARALAAIRAGTLTLTLALTRTIALSLLAAFAEGSALFVGETLNTLLHFFPTRLALLGAELTKFLETRLPLGGSVAGIGLLSLYRRHRRQ